MRVRTQELTVGVFILIGLMALIFLALRVSGLSLKSGEETYRVTAKFENIGGLTARAKVTMAGVTIGRVTRIYLDREDFVGVVEMEIYKNVNNLSSDSSAAILTAGILGEKYIGIIQGAELDNLADGSEIYNTQSALVLEDLIAKFLVGRVSSDEP
ncbi:outer membrane lipid asymmetry maintenance protein MlaD [Ketobacter sp. MCCC 1A13808]|uniref:outer membrane lipid asymmetry maintenance protein MlaD n=1 Tax=Ketobacter sp. MCCC 1A13808 TaxID=2602738 RepID=UPI000F258486|nr:outer membrane lipid asymmetry maintenance protein MlaD [Ketobacter sp. MCCC 1A13808]MVF11239.1 outer membrane lipid asymmetry maintenance protein MlaD [Ketobacter sp. MCCC 1A13808]RLP53630.1 MAG: outer membrane lipid asymmetry maintenance protein MlaD [Ketobacter sp.]